MSWLSLFFVDTPKHTKDENNKKAATRITTVLGVSPYINVKRKFRWYSTWENSWLDIDN
jgi:hypothetical protein